MRTLGLLVRAASPALAILGAALLAFALDLGWSGTLGAACLAAGTVGLTHPPAHP